MDAWDADAHARSPLPDGRTAWLAEQILPHEPALRRWLCERLALASADVDDIVQESYARLAGMDTVEHVSEPRAYLFTVARSLVQQQLRHRQVVAIETVAELDGLGAEAPQASPERVASAREQLAFAQRLLASMPARCRQVFQLRRIEGLSQHEVSQRLRISQSTVEKHMIKALRLMMDAIATAGPPGDEHLSGGGQGRARRKERPHGNG